MNSWAEVEQPGGQVRTPERILLDIETQKDFFEVDGSCYVVGSSAIAIRIYRLFDWAGIEGVQVVSTVLRNRPGERGPMASADHCVDGTRGEQKLQRTILDSCINLGLRNSTDLPLDLFDKYQQVIFEKCNTDIFLHARAERLISELGRSTFIICGAGVTGPIAQAAIGLCVRGFAVVLARDAVVDFGDPEADMAYRRMRAKGVVFARTSQIVTARAIPVRARMFRQALSAG